MEIIYNLAFGLLMLFVAYMVYAWGDTWYHRRHGYSWDNGTGRWYILNRPDYYLLHHVWTWVVLLAVAGILCWHVLLAVFWFVDLAFEVMT